MPSAWTTNPTSSTRNGRERQATRSVATSPPSLCTRVSVGRVPGAGDRAEHAAGQQQRDEHRHRQVAAPAAAERVDDGGRPGAGQQDAEREGGHPPRHQRRPLARVVGDLRGLGDVGHLEAPVRGRREQERARDPHRRQPRRALGPAKTSTNSGGRASPPASIHGRRGPQRLSVRSERLPIHGFRTTSHALGANTTSPAMPRPPRARRSGSRGAAAPAPCRTPPSRSSPARSPRACRG